MKLCIVAFLSFLGGIFSVLGMEIDKYQRWSDSNVGSKQVVPLSPRITSSFIEAFRTGKLIACIDKSITFADYQNSGTFYNYPLSTVHDTLEEFLSKGVPNTQFDKQVLPQYFFLESEEYLQKNLSILTHLNEEDTLALCLWWFIDFLETKPIKTKKDEVQFKLALYEQQKAVELYIKQKEDLEGYSFEDFIEKSIAITLNRNKLQKAFRSQNPLAINEICKYPMNLVLESLDQKIASLKDEIKKALGNGSDEFCKYSTLENKELIDQKEVSIKKNGDGIVYERNKEQIARLKGWLLEHVVFWKKH